MKVFIDSINIYEYWGKGGVSKFIKKYGRVKYDSIIKHTEILNEGKHVNRKFNSRLYFIKYFNSDYNRIKIENLSFDGEKFMKKSKNSAKRGWVLVKTNNNDDIYSYDETKKNLQSNKKYKQYLGKGKNRTLMKENIKLYSSIYKHTSHLDCLNKNYNKLTHRILFIINDYKTHCVCGNKYTWKLENGDLNFVCGKCVNPFPTYEWFEEKYNGDASDEYEKYFNYIKSKKTNSLEWYKKKHGEGKGFEMYRERYINLGKKLTELKHNKFSKISQDLFSKITNNLNDEDKIYYHQKNKEFVLQIPSKYNVDKTVFFLDFKYKNKIIEYNGKYWHNEKDDNIRYDILTEMGYDVMYVSSDEYNRNKRSIEIINKLNVFLKDADK